MNQSRSARGGCWLLLTAALCLGLGVGPARAEPEPAGAAEAKAAEGEAHQKKAAEGEAKDAAGEAKAGEGEAAATKAAVPRYTLRELEKMAHQSYPGVAAAQQAVSLMEAKAFRARWSWIPQGRVRGLVAPAPEVRCIYPVYNAQSGVLSDNTPADKETREKICLQTTSTELNSLNIAGIFLRLEVELGAPIYTFDKLGSAKRAAAAGVEAEQARVQTVKDRLSLDITKAYWGLVLGRDLLNTIQEGRKHLVKAIDKVEEELDEGEGESTLTDLLRLKAARAEVDARKVDAEKLVALTTAALGTLSGQRDKAFDVATPYLEPIQAELQPLEAYQQRMSSSRSDIRALRAAVAAARAGVDLEKARFYPDFVLVATASLAYTSSADDPENAFYNDPFNSIGAGFGLALNWQWDQVQQYGKYREAKATLAQTEAKRREALAGMDLELRKAYAELDAAKRRLDVARKGEKAAWQWLTAVSQNLAAGLVPATDINDALVAYFQQRVRYLQTIYEVNVGWAELGRVVGRGLVK